MKKIIFFLVVVCVFNSCKKDPEKEPEPAVYQSGYASGEGVFITSEGNFTFGNAKVAYYNYSSHAVSSDVFQTVNGRPLGDVCQSMRVINNKGYIVLNNSAKIEVVSMNDFKSTATITGFVSPRYILPVSASKAYVTDLYSNSIYIVNLSTNQVSGTIICPGWSEQLIKSGNNVYVANHEKGKVYVINSLNDQLTDSITVSKGANSLSLDNAGKLWVMCSGETTSSINGALYRINIAANSVEATLPFAAGESPWRLTSNSTSDTLFYLNNGVYKIWTGASSLPSSAFIGQGSRNYYGLGIHPQTGQVYVSDAIDYVQAGKIYIYSKSGSPVSDFLAGIIPGEFCFY